MDKNGVLWSLRATISIFGVRHGKQSLLAEKINQFQAHEFQILVNFPFTFKIYHKNGVAFLLTFTSI